MAAPTSVLVFGDINGQFEALFSKMDYVQKNVGHIAFALCVGNFFKEGCEKEWERVKRSEICPCTHIYILGPTKPGLIKFYPSFKHMTDLTDRITFLGKSGIIRSEEGIRIAFLSGSFSTEAHTNPTHIHYSYKDIYNILHEANNSGRIDIIMSKFLPYYLGCQAETNNFPETGELPPAVLFTVAFPRNYMATTEKESFETSTLRYFNNGSLAGASSVFGIPELGKKKWMKVINVEPRSMQEPELKINLSKIVALDIPNLYEFCETMQENALLSTNDTNSTYTNSTYDVESGECSTSKKHTIMEWKKGYTNYACRFCLFRCADQKHLVLSIGKHAFMALATGPVVEDHVLISSMAHRNTAENLDEETLQEINRYKDALRKFYGPNRVPVFYERAYKYPHLQIHCIPVPMNKAGNVLTAFKELATKYSLEVEANENSRLGMKLSNNCFHLYADIPYKIELIIKGDADKFPQNFGREAVVSILDLPGKKNWKDCVQPKELEEKAAENFKIKFNKFNFTLV